ncbi:alpha/beta fold hydrolase [Roseovarius aquimarinus]|uniref:Alpha/beta fold hydrolase n=1 Tax=Roseovarius aquimarinus TaxID=1229156 RepID=A0ABW7IAI4_9RHOB
MSWALGALTALAAAPFLREGLRPRMGARARQAAPGAFAALPQGATHYRWLGAESGPVAVCVHGLTTPSPVWEALAEALGGMGYRVLIYDLYGRGYSDRPRGAQDADFFAGQLEALLADQGIEEKITLLGYSMGGMIAPRFAVRNPGRLRRMILLAPAGIGHDLGPASRLMANTGPFGTWAMLLIYGRSLRRALEAERAQPGAVPGMIDIQIAQTRQRGFLPAVLSSLRHTLDTDCAADHRALAEAGTPVLAIWAEKDEVIPLAGRETLAAWNPGAGHEVVPDAGHALPYSHPEEVAAILRRRLGD